MSVGSEAVVRAVVPEDLGYLTACLEAELRWDDPDMEFFLGEWGRLGDHGVVAELEDSRLGAAWCRLFGSAPSDSGFVNPKTPVLTNLWVDPQHRRRGVGTRLLRDLVDWARESGYPGMTLATDQDNPAARLYLKVGFAITGVVGSRWAMTMTFAPDARP